MAKQQRKLTDIVSIDKIQPFWLEQLPEITACLDTGYYLEETKNIIKRMYPTVDFSKQQLAIHLLRRLYDTETVSVEFLIKPENLITFSHDWNNKLQCRYFTTIRIHNPTKYQVN